MRLARFKVKNSGGRGDLVVSVPEMPEMPRTVVMRASFQSDLGQMKRVFEGLMIVSDHCTLWTGMVRDVHKPSWAAPGLVFAKGSLMAEQGNQLSIFG